MLTFSRQYRNGCRLSSWLFVGIVALLHQCCLSDATSDTGWTLDSSSASCSGAFVLNSLSVSCANNDGACVLGEQVTLEGQCTYMELK
jgi:hypothetical protein